MYYSWNKYSLYSSILLLCRDFGAKLFWSDDYFTFCCYIVIFAKPFEVYEIDDAMSSEIISTAENVRDFEYAVQLTRFLLLPLGLWPTKSAAYRRFLRPFAIVMCIFIMMFVMIPLCLFMFLIVRDLGVRQLFIKLTILFNWGSNGDTELLILFDSNLELNKNILSSRRTNKINR